MIVSVPTEFEDEVAGALGAGSLGVEVRDGEGGRRQLRIYHRSEAHAHGMKGRAERILGGFGLDAAVSAEPVEDLSWVERYQRSLRPLPLGRGFVVVPRAGLRTRGGRVPVILVPGRAFGTGEHATTRMCAWALEERVKPGSRWLDLGCGSGILAVIAVLCGAARALARDTDPEAVEVAREVVAANGMEERIEVEHGSDFGLAGAGFDGIVANIAAPYFLSGAPACAAALRAGGTLLASGFVDEEEPRTSAALAAAGLAPKSRHGEDGWALVVAVRESVEIGGR